MLDAFDSLLCLKLCWHNWHKPTNKLAFHALSEFASTAESIGIQIDESVLDNRKGCGFAQKVMDILEPISVAEAKVALLPLQGQKLWHQWAKHDKDSYRTPQIYQSRYQPKFRAKEKETQEEQYVYASNLSPLMKCFIDGLVNQSTLVKIFFLQWLKFYLDDRSRKTLPEMRLEYEKIRTESTDLQELKRRNIPATSERLIDVGDSIQKQSKKLIEGSNTPFMNWAKFMKQKLQTIVVVMMFNVTRRL